MTKINWKKLIPHIAALVIFVLVAVIYCQPALEGKVVTSFDVSQFKGMVHQSQQYKDIHGTYPLWINSIFGGMPAFQIAMSDTNPIPMYLFQPLTVLFLPSPISFFFLLCFSFYFLAQVLRINPWISIVSALAYAYASFSAILVIAGHETEILSMGYLPFLLGSLLLLYEGKYLWGTALTALFTFQLIAINHLQVTYYGIIVAGFMTLSFIIEWIKTKQYKHLVIAGLLALTGGGLGVMGNAMGLVTTYDFSKETMRNGGLTLDTATNTVTKSKGLDVDYAFAWSYGPAETFTIVAPNIYGGSSFVRLPQDGKLVETLADKQLPQKAADEIYNSFAPYWGPQDRGTSGPVYLGAVMTLLFIFGVVYSRSPHKWWLLAVTLLAFLMALGKHFSAFNDFLFYHLPMYNKFRAPTMSLIIPQLTFPIVAMLGLQQLFFGSDDKAYIWKKFKVSLTVTGVLLVLLVGLYASFSYRTANEVAFEQQINQSPLAKNDPTLGRAIVSAASADRQSLYGSDLLRSIVYILLGAALLFLFIKGKIKMPVALAGLGLLVFIDLITVDTRYLYPDLYKDPDDANTAFNPSLADQQISRDAGYYRVFNTTPGDPWSDAMTSYFHNSVGGYNAAKLSLYNDLITYQLGRGNMQAFDMLNTKYFIVADRQTNQLQAQQNPGALGPCWFVNSIEYVPNPAAAMKALSHFTARDTAIVEETAKSEIPFAPVYDSTGYVRLIKNDNDLITYESSSNSNEFAVFSEIYYNRGWKAYIDDKEAPIVKTDYLLRGLAVPAGKHNIRFEFKPASYATGVKLTDIGSALIVLLLLGAIVQTYRDAAAKKKKTA